MKKKKIINLLKTFMFFTLKTTKHCCEKLKVFYDFNVAPQLVIVVNNPPANTGDARSILGSGGPPGGGNGNPPQCSCLEHLMDSGAWRARVRGVTESRTRSQRDVCVCVCVLVTQPCPTLCDPLDCDSPGSSVLGISR